MADFSWSTYLLCLATVGAVALGLVLLWLFLGDQKSPEDLPDFRRKP